MTRQEIQQLIEKYDDGMTTCAEETVLREYFRSLPDADMPREWRAYKMMFAFFDGKKAETVKPAARPRKRYSLGLYLRVASVAACIAVALVLALPRGNQHDGYAVLNGKKTTDQSIVRAEAEAALQMVTYTEEDAFGALNDL